MLQRCIICQLAIQTEEESVTCEKCQCVFHAECWQDLGGCGTYGCENSPTLQKESLAQSTKKCPFCQESIPADTMACPYCRERFNTILPQTAQDIVRERWGPRRAPSIKENKGALWVFICGLLGITAPFNLIIGGSWYLQNRRALKSVSPMYNLLAIVGLAVSVIYSLIFFVAIVT